MRVAHFIQRYPPALGGSEAYFARLSEFLVHAGDTVRVMTTTAIDLEAFWSFRGRCAPAGETVEAGVEVARHSLLRWPGRRYVLKLASLFPCRPWQCLTLPCNPISLSMWRAAGRHEPAVDLVHASAFPYAWPLMCGLRLARRQQVPYLLTPFLHLGDPDNPQDPSRRAYLAPPLVYLLRAADRVFVQGKSELAALRNLPLAEHKLVLLGMGVDESECTGGDRAKVRKVWGVGPDEVVIGHLANQSVEKGTVDLLRAAARLWEQGRDWRVILAGPEMPNFQRYWQASGGHERVKRLGVLTLEEKRDFFAGIDLFALPSRSDSFGLVLLEAWANGVPNVAYKAGGIADVIQHEHDGLLVPCGDVSALAHAIDALACDAKRRSKLGEAGRQRVKQEFRWPDKLRKVREVYEEVLAESRRNAARQ